MFLHSSSTSIIILNLLLKWCVSRFLVKKLFIHLLIVGGIVIFGVWIFRSFFFSPTALLDTYDQPFIVFILHNQGRTFLEGRIGQIFELPMFHPLKHIGLLSDLFIPLGLIFGLLETLLKSPILAFHVIFFLTITANCIAAYWLSSRVAKNAMSRIATTIFLTYSPYFFLQYDRFQMIQYWLVFLVLGLLFKKKYTLKHIALIGFLAGVQCWLEIYFAVFLLVAICFYAFVHVGISVKKKTLLSKLTLWKMYTLMFILSFVITAGPVIAAYRIVQRNHALTRVQGEYVSYAAHITDYLFPLRKETMFSTLPFVQQWSALNLHTRGEFAVFPGFALLLLTLYGVWKWLRSPKRRVTDQAIFLSLLLFCGFLFSLGPRCNFNGTYCTIPLPYFALMKWIPLFEPIRATARWSFFVFLALGLFAGKILDRSRNWCAIVFIVLFLFETIPISLDAAEVDFTDSSFLSEQCKKSDVLLEYPFNDETVSDELRALPYKTRMLFSAVYHGCTLVNGYSGFYPPRYQNYVARVDLAMERQNISELLSLLDEANVRYLRLHADAISSEKFMRVARFLQQNGFVQQEVTQDSMIFVRK